MVRGRTLHCAAGMCFSGRDLGNIQPFQHKMFLSCADNTFSLSCSENYESSVKHEKNLPSEGISGIIHCC